MNNTTDFVVVNNSPADRRLMAMDYKHENVLDLLDDVVTAKSNVSFDVTGLSVYHVPNCEAERVRSILTEEAQERAYEQRNRMQY